jgi:hypothetical protein
MPTPADSAASPESSGPPSEPGVCDSCGARADDLARVRRVYVTPGAWDLAGDEQSADRVDVVDEAEAWCFPCRSQYPHQPLDG